VSIDTLDNPGWSLLVDLKDTELEGRPFSRLAAMESDTSWIQCEVVGTKWRGTAGPLGLGRLIRAFREWAS
jgi:hypothetical protein